MTVATTAPSAPTGDVILLRWGERVVRPIRQPVIHTAQVIVLAACIDRLVHPVTARRLSTICWRGVPTTDRRPPPRLLLAPTADVSYRQRTWRYHAVLALLGRRAPRDLLTGERLEVEQFFGARLQGHHLFPRKWCATHPEEVPTELVESVVNIAPLTGYTNAWISARAPREYLAGIRAVVGDQAMHELLRDHLIEPDLLEAHDFAGFWNHRLGRIHAMLVAAVDPEGLREES